MQCIVEVIAFCICLLNLFIAVHSVRVLSDARRSTDTVRIMLTRTILRVHREKCLRSLRFDVDTMILDILAQSSDKFCSAGSPGSLRQGTRDRSHLVLAGAGFWPQDGMNHVNRCVWTLQVPKCCPNVAHVLPESLAFSLQIHGQSMPGESCDLLELLADAKLATSRWSVSVPCLLRLQLGTCWNMLEHVNIVNML